MFLHRLEWGVVLRKRNIEKMVLEAKYLVTRKEDEACLFKQGGLFKQLNVFTVINNMYLVCQRHCSTAQDSGENVSVGCLFQAEHYCLNFKEARKFIYKYVCSSKIKFPFRHVMRLTVPQFSSL